MKKKKRVKVHFGNLIILIIIIGIGIFGIKTLYKQLNTDDTNNTNSENKFESDPIKDKLVNLGYSKSESEEIINNLDKEEIEKIDKKYDYLVEFSKIKYFHIENIERYINLKNKSDYSYDEIIMRVNTSIDKEFYTDIKTVDNPNDLLVLVNKFYALPSGIEPNDLIQVESVKMQREAGKALKEMATAMRNDGLKIILQSGYRSEDTQSYLYNRYVARDGKEEADTYSARPNHSEHQTGLAIDVSHDGTLEEYFEDTPQFEWLQDNAHKYGFILRYPKDKVYMTGYTYEPWHYRYVGIEVATLIKNENITFEEYYVKYKGLY